MDIASKKVLITGADGFIGSHLTEMLVDLVGSLKVLCQYNSFNSWGWLDDVKINEGIEIVLGDVRDPHFCLKLLKDIDVVFHLAALIAIPYSYVAPKSYIDTNVNGTLNICQAALDNQCERVIHTSTSEVYGTAQYVPIDENHPLQPQSPYSASKTSADMIAMSYFNSFDLPIVIARPFNTYGPRQSTRAVIPTIITQIAKGARKIKLGDLTPTRDFNYVKDTCKGFVDISKCNDLVGEVVNIGSNRDISIEVLLKMIREMMSSDIDVESDGERIRPKKSEVFRLLCDNKKLRDFTGYDPDFTLEQGLKETIDWFTTDLNLQKFKDGYTL